MRAPARRAEEIKNGIVNILLERGPRTADEMAKLFPLIADDTLEDAVRKQLTRLGAIKRRYGRDAVKRTRKAARDMLGTLDRLQWHTKHAPSALKISLGLVPSWPKGHPCYRENEIQAFISVMRAQCDACLGKLPRSDRVKLDCARSAYHLLSVYTKHAPTSSVGSPFRMITGLLFEAVTGSPDRDLKWTCENVLKEKRAGWFWTKRYAGN